jgi:type IV pilus assembly protein PilC
VPEFVCRLGTPDGAVVEQRRIGATAEALQRELEGEGFHVFVVSRGRARLRIPLLTRGENVSGQEFLVFNTQLRTLLKAGLPLAQSLDLLRSQQTSPHFRNLLTKVHQQVTTGVSLSDAFLSLGDTFPRLYANTVRAGERSGELEFVLGRYVEYQRLVEGVRRKIVASLTYPMVLVLLSMCLVVILMVKVIPAFRDFFVGFGAELPLPTKVVMGISNTVSDHFMLFAAGLVAAFVGFRFWKETPSGRLLVDRITLRIPMVGRIAHLFSLTQFSRSMAVLLGGGTPMVPALETSASSIKNTYLSELFLTCVTQVREGRPLSDSLEGTRRMPDLALAMMRVGESTGALPEMLSHTSDFFDEEIDFTLNRLVTLFEPAILVVMGIIVAGLLLAVYYPLLTLVAKMN